MTHPGELRIGLIGAGIMGTAIGGRLLSCELHLTVCDRDPDKVAALVAKGAHAASSAREVAAVTDIIILSLNTASIVRNVIFGTDGVAAGSRPSTLIIDMSSIDPESTRRLADDLEALDAGHWLDCPLSGGAPGASTGTLTVMAGGSEEDFEHARSVMRHLTANFTLMGPVGAGQATKMVNQILCGIAFQAIAEATILAERGGVAVERIPHALRGGRADSRILQEFMTKMAQRDYTPTGRLQNMVKDLSAALETASETNLYLPLTQITADIHERFSQEGYDDGDNCVLMEQFVHPEWLRPEPKE